MPSLLDPETFLEILKPDRCPVCFLVHNYVREHLKSLLDESVTDPASRDKLFASRGFCRHHAWQAVHQRQALGVGVIYASLLEKGLRELPPTTSLWKKKKPSPCPLCESEKSRDHSCVREFAHCYSQSEKLRSDFAQKGVLCLSHLEQALAFKMGPSEKKSLLESGKGALEGLLKDLNEFLEKQDYHRSQEASGPEWDSWIRAVRMISGERE